VRFRSIYAPLYLRTLRRYTNNIILYLLYITYLLKFTSALTRKESDAAFESKIKSDNVNNETRVYLSVCHVAELVMTITIGSVWPSCWKWTRMRQLLSTWLTFPSPLLPSSSKSSLSNRSCC